MIEQLGFGAILGVCCCCILKASAIVVWFPVEINGIDSNASSSKNLEVTLLFKIFFSHDDVYWFYYIIRVLIKKVTANCP